MMKNLISTNFNLQLQQVIFFAILSTNVNKSFNIDFAVRDQSGFFAFSD